MKTLLQAFTTIQLVIITSLPAYSQYESAGWILKYNLLKLKITDSAFLIDTLQSAAQGFVAHSTISDGQGNLLFFSFGVDARDKNGNLIDNGCCLCESPDMPGNCLAGANGHPGFQGCLILPRPEHSQQYYLIIKDMFLQPNGQPGRVQVSLVDMSYNNGLGKVLERSKPILSDTLSDSRMAAVKHANGRDWWLVNHEYNTNRIYTNLITPDSIYGPYEQSIGYPGLEPDAYGWSLFSQDGSVFATATGGMAGLTLLNFDRCSGLFSGFRNIPFHAATDEIFYQLAFSPSGQFLYLGNSYMSRQYDLWDTALSYATLVIDTEGYPYLNSYVLMPDKRIYLSGWTGLGECLSVIDSPDLRYPNCIFHLRSQCVPGSIIINSVPSFANYNLYALANSGCDTLGVGIAQAEKEKQLTVYPNPASEFITIDYGYTNWSKGDAELQIVNSIGQTVYEQKLLSYSAFQKIDVSHFANGVYLVTIKQQGQLIAKAKFVKE